MRDGDGRVLQALKVRVQRRKFDCGAGQADQYYRDPLTPQGPDHACNLLVQRLLGDSRPFDRHVRSPRKLTINQVCSGLSQRAS
ncbi:hypothetical protein [Sphingomonas sp. BAUL-RG-20F-R05-02]|uniref:hypothetical protein n=1 Tax=Sphingomonas sp. BAUL-RG-20F-R05-02 TaxID=2914830 RepID=UPI001F568110|nr:hypothetical protein [Sphingomonas sp. BAUL-RG-20F-R05-02]